MLNARPFRADFLNFRLGERGARVQRRAHKALVQLFRAAIEKHGFRGEGVKFAACVHQLRVDLVVVGFEYAQRQIHFQRVAANGRGQQLRGAVAQQGKARAVRRFRGACAVLF